jgi:hypothetical protein
MDRAEDHDGIALQVIENMGAAGDVMLPSGGIDLPSRWPHWHESRGNDAAIDGPQVVRLSSLRR